MSQSTAKNKNQPTAKVVLDANKQPLGESRELSQTKDGRLRVDISEETALALLLEVRRIRIGFQMVTGIQLDEIL